MSLFERDGDGDGGVNQIDNRISKRKIEANHGKTRGEFPLVWDYKESPHRPDSRTNQAFGICLAEDVGQKWVF